MKTLLSWRRPTTKETEVSIWRIWGSKCGRYRVVHSKSKYGYPDAFVAEKLLYNGVKVSDQTIASTKKKDTAIAACEKAERLRLRELEHGNAE